MSVKKMDEVPEKKTESKILAKMGKKEQGRCQKESVVLKNGQSTDNGKHVTVRVQRIRKIHIKQKLIILSYTGGGTGNTGCFFRPSLSL